MATIALAVPAALAISACNSASERNALDEGVGAASEPPISIEVAGGLAHVRELSTSGATLWSQGPELSMELRNDGPAIDEFELIVLNALATTELVVREGATGIAELERARPTERQFRIAIGEGELVRLDLVRVAPPGTSFRVAVLGDIQTALKDVDEVFEVINQTAELEFVISTGDIVETASSEEFDLWDSQLPSLNIPFYSTIGNHEIRGDFSHWHERYGRYSIYFVYRGVAFSFVDSGNGGVHPSTTADLELSLDANRDRLHLVGTHYPPFDPSGSRSGSFRSRKEASAFLARLAEGEVDITFYGHIHSFYAYENAGIPAFISGGGGAYPERWDGVGRHFLVVRVEPTAQTAEVALVRVD